MLPMNDLSSDELVEAVRVWTGWGRCTHPDRDDARLTKHLGQEVAARLLPLVKALEADFYASDARLEAPSLPEMGRLASKQFKRKHPTVADDIVAAFEWCYTFDNR
jgi:hypothetical protein